MRAALILWAAWPSLAAAAPVAVRASPGAQQLEPCAAASDSGFVVAWVEARPLAREIRAAASADGQAWSSALALSGPGGTDESMRPGCAAAGDEVVVAWSSAAGGDHDVFAAWSHDGGRSFDPPARVAGGAGGQLAPRVAVGADGRAYVVFHDSFGSTADDGGVVWHVRISTSDRGGPWSPARTVDRGGVMPLFPAVSVAEAGALAVVWLDGEAVAGALSVDGGASFSPPVVIASGAREPPLVELAEPYATVWYAGTSTGAEQRDPALWVQEAAYLDVWAVRTSTALAPQGAPRPAHAERRLHQHQAAVAAGGAALAWIDHARAGVRRVTWSRGTEALAPDDPAREVARPTVACHPARGCVVAWSEEVEGGTFAVRAIAAP